MERGDLVGLECHIGGEGPGRRGEQTALVLVMDLEVVLVPEHQVAATILVVVHLVDTALTPGVVSISVGSVDPAQIGGRTDLHRIGERAVAHLDEHPEAIDVRHDQVVAAVAVHVPGHVHMRDLLATWAMDRLADEVDLDDDAVAARRVEAGIDRHQLPFGRRFGIEPVQAAALVGDQPVASADVGHIHEHYAGT